MDLLKAQNAKNIDAKASMFFARWSYPVSKLAPTGAHWNKNPASWAPWIKVPIIN